ncbi:cytochrome P450 [Sciscionella marina]|uniref:cytochrome P450 n=1 Tax=Sciscionella marina TaxID=508770 RepID=UPI0003A073E4|nr:cytochrome P450 [Sciscionella marina]
MPQPTSTPTPVSALPTERPTGCPFDPPAELGPLRTEAPLRRMTYPDGHVGWLATGHAAVRAVLADPRISIRYELLHYPLPGLPIDSLPPASPGDLTGVDPPEHTRYRKLLTGKFTVRRMRALTDRIEQFAAEALDAMQRTEAPVDLVAAYARPIPALMICELLGVPYEDRQQFQRNAEIVTGNTPSEQTEPAWNALHEFMAGLVATKQATPTNDLLPDLTGSDLTDQELTTLGVVLLGAGLDTTANMLALGTFALLQHPDQLATLRADPALIDSTVEELLRYLTITHTMVRAATEDVEIGGQLIKAGETVTLSTQAANRDPARFPNPDALDLYRTATGHLAFGHGIHQCLGQQLARVQMRVAFPALLSRFPSLRLAIPPNEVPLRTDGGAIYGAHHLPVTWDPH